MTLKSVFGPSFCEHLVISSNIWSLASINGVTGETPMTKHRNFTDSRKTYHIYEMGGELSHFCNICAYFKLKMAIIVQFYQRKVP